MNSIVQGDIPASKEIKLAMDYVNRKLNNDDVFIDCAKIDRAVELMEKYFEIKLLDWELFVVALVHCFYESDDTVVFDEFFIMMGRGGGKNGFISPLAWYFTTPDHGIREYNVDIIANAEDQAKTSFDDVYSVLERKWKKLKRFFYKSKQKIVNLKTNSYIKYNTSNAKTKDGKRSGCLIFDETHEYETYDLIKVFTSGFGKKKHARAFYITTNGYVRGGVLDQQLEMAQRVLSGEITDLGMLPLIYKIDEKEQVNDESLWVMAVPSYPSFPNLQKEMKKEFAKMQYQHHIRIEFLTKRMNCPVEDVHEVAAPWEQVLKTNREIPYDELAGFECLGALDYAMITDFASVGLLFKYKGQRFFIEHTFVCHKALSVESRPIKFPVNQAVEKGLITIIHEDSIQPKVIADWFIDMARTYNIKKVLCDSYRAALIRDEFTSRGLPLEETRSGPITHSKVAPLIESIFADEKIVFGDNMTMRWYINNTKKNVDKKGNTTYEKIEPKTRKTDGFFGFIHAISHDDELVEAESFMSLDVQTF